MKLSRSTSLDGDNLKLVTMRLSIIAVMDEVKEILDGLMSHDFVISDLIL